MINVGFWHHRTHALAWSVAEEEEKFFRRVFFGVALLTAGFGAVLPLLHVEKADRLQVTELPQRFAKMLLDRPPPPEERRIETPRPQLNTLKAAPDVKAPATREERKAAEKAKGTGILALGRELSGLMDTTSINKMVGGKTQRIDASAANVITAPNRQLFAAESGRGSGGVDGGRITAAGRTTQLADREGVTVKQNLLAAEGSGGGAARASRGGGRGEDELSIAFDQNKGVLYSVYDRARRKNPGLRGKIVLEITIAPGGEVANVRIVSSELGDPELEQGLLRRIRMFKLDAKNVKPITVTYPIEFLPS